MKKKGFTLVEVITSIVLVSVILTFMLASLVKIREAYSIVNRNTDVLVYSASITRILNNDLKSNGGIRSMDCNNDGNECNIVLNNDAKRIIRIQDNELSKIQKVAQETFSGEEINVPDSSIRCDSKLKTNGNEYYCPVKKYTTTLEYLDSSGEVNKLIYIKTLELVREQDLTKGINNYTGYIFKKITFSTNNFKSKNGINNNIISKINIKINDNMDFNDSTYDIALYSSSVQKSIPDPIEEPEIPSPIEEPEIPVPTEDPVIDITNLYAMVENAFNNPFNNTIVKYGTSPGESEIRHNDTYNISGNSPIYYYKSNDNNNVIFADYCWQILRTTDTGGVKLIYNGKAVNNQCLQTRSNQVGYDGERSISSIGLDVASSYYYADDYEYSNGSFKLIGTKRSLKWESSSSNDLVGKYTCISNSENGTCSNLYLISQYDNILGGSAIELNANSKYSQFGTLQQENIYTSLADSNIKVLKNNKRFFTTALFVTGDLDYSSVRPYFCIKASGTTCNIKGKVLKKEGNEITYNNTDIDLNDTLSSTASDTTMQFGLEAWYKKTISTSQYSHFIEQNAIFCNKRSVIGNTLPQLFNLVDWIIGGEILHPNGRKLTALDQNLGCIYQDSQFSVGNSQAKINYPIGLLTGAEANILENIRNSSNNYYIGATYYIAGDGFMSRIIGESGAIALKSAVESHGVRGVISLNSSATVADNNADGSPGNPFIIE